MRYLASSNVDGTQIATAAEVASEHHWTPFVGTQLEWNLLKRDVERDAVPAARDHELGIIPYYPLASGLLTGKYRAGQAPPEGSRLGSSEYFANIWLKDDYLERVEQLRPVAEAEGRSLLEFAVAWLLAQEGVTSVICGATSPQQVAANAAAADWQMSAAELSVLT